MSHREHHDLLGAGLYSSEGSIKRLRLGGLFASLFHSLLGLLIVLHWIHKSIRRKSAPVRTGKAIVASNVCGTVEMTLAILLISFIFLREVTLKAHEVYATMSGIIFDAPLRGHARKTTEGQCADAGIHRVFHSQSSPREIRYCNLRPMGSDYSYRNRIRRYFDDSRPRPPMMGNDD